MKLMNLPTLWNEAVLYPETLFLGQLESYTPGSEEASEHYRYGAFNWWIKQNPPVDKIAALLRAATLDTDPQMAEDARQRLKQCSHYSR